MSIVRNTESDLEFENRIRPRELGSFAGQEKLCPLYASAAADRPRSSPLTSPGIQLELSTVGSSDSIAHPTTTRNTVVAAACCEAADTLEKSADF